MTSLKEHELLERLTVLKAAWILGHGRMPQPWFKLDKRFSTKKLMFMLHSGYQAIEATRSVRLPAGFSDDVANNFHFHNCMTRLQMESKADRSGFVFNYKNEFYQDVRHFCKQYTGLNQSAAAADVENTNFPKTACLVVPGYSCFRTLKLCKNTDLSTRQGDAYILAKGEKPTRPYLLLVSLTELKRAATAAIISAERRRHSGFVTRVLAAKEAERRRRKQRSKSVIKDSRKGDRHRSRRNQARIEPSVQWSHEELCRRMIFPHLNSWNEFKHVIREIIKKCLAKHTEAQLVATKRVNSNHDSTGAHFGATFCGYVLVIMEITFLNILHLYLGSIVQT